MGKNCITKFWAKNKLRIFVLKSKWYFFLKGSLENFKPCFVLHLIFYLLNEFNWLQMIIHILKLSTRFKMEESNSIRKSIFSRKILSKKNGELKISKSSLESRLSPGFTLTRLSKSNFWSNLTLAVFPRFNLFELFRFFICYAADELTTRTLQPVI